MLGMQYRDFARLSSAINGALGRDLQFAISTGWCVLQAVSGVWFYDVEMGILVIWGGGHWSGVVPVVDSCSVASYFVDRCSYLRLYLLSCTYITRTLTGEGILYNFYRRDHGDKFR